MNDKEEYTEALRTLRHDIKNQLSNIHLALETIKFEISEPTEDITFCLDTIANAAGKINDLLKEPQ